MIGASTFIGKFIGSYRIVAVMSSSPFNHVYRGEQHFHTGHTVAIKLWHNLHLSPQKQLHFLQYIHQYDIIHGNLKPENILFTARGEALLTDFTFSTLLEAASSKYAPGINSAHYMAPEQFQGTTSKASDQYALGCIAYELLTGRVPFTAVDLLALGRKHATESPLAL